MVGREIAVSEGARPRLVSTAKGGISELATHPVGASHAVLQTSGVGSSSACTRKAPRPNAVPQRQRTWPLHATRSAQTPTINRSNTQENSPLGRAVNQRIPQARTQVKTSIDIHRQYRRPHILRREPVGRVVAAQVAIVPPQAPGSSWRWAPTRLAANVGST